MTDKETMPEGLKTNWHGMWMEWWTETEREYVFHYRYLWWVFPITFNKSAILLWVKALRETLDFQEFELLKDIKQTMKIPRVNLYYPDPCKRSQP